MNLVVYAGIGVGAYLLGKGGVSEATTTKPLTESPQIQQPQKQQQPIRIQYQNPPNAPTKTQNILVASGTALVVVLYYYYSSSRQTKVIVNKVEETAGETQDLVRECDENNEKRIQELDKKNQERKNELSTEILSESRSHFKVIGSQLKLLAEVSVETLKQVANGVVRGDDNELNSNSDHALDLLEVVNSYEEQSNINMSTESFLQARDECLKEVQEEISARERNKNEKKITANNIKHEFVTPGGPDDYNTPGGPNSDSKDNFQKSFLQNVTNTFSRNNTKSNSDNNDEASYTDWILTKVGGTPYKYYSNTRDFYKQHDQKIQLLGIALGSYLVFKKLSTLIWKKEENKTQTITLQS